ncbi:MAG: N,N-dimethylformamidase beta subunit family domain-containing protein [Nitrososphaeraceae archaeon]
MPDVGIRPDATVPSAIIPVLVIFVIITSYFIPSLLLNHNPANAVPINASVRSNSHSHSIVDTNRYIAAKPKLIMPSAFGSALHKTTGLDDKNIDIAFIKPSFTAAAYDHSFYVFYTLYQSASRKNVTTDLNLLTSKVTSHATDSSPSAFAMSYLSKNIQSLIPKSKIVMLTDADVDSGNIFTTKNKFNKYDILVIGHQEYVIQQEYDNLRQFVSHGGTMIILDGNIFYAEVKYDRNSHTITLVKGHGWAFNGRSAWKSVAERWRYETSQWAGSNYLCYSCSIIFDNDPFEYKHHEEQYVTNPKDVILFNYNASMPSHDNDDNDKPSGISLTPSSSSQLLSSNKMEDITTKHIIATYELKYQKGKVIALGIYADDIITNNKFDKYFDNLLLRYAM